VSDSTNDNGAYVKPLAEPRLMVKCAYCHVIAPASDLLDDWNGRDYRCTMCGGRFHLAEAENWIGVPDASY
jgi:DNA-directed RNA polymerase subunit RPC12/RpoP